MNKTSKRFNIRRIICAALTATIIAATGILLSGCMLIRGIIEAEEELIDFNVRSLTLDVGESYDLQDIISCGTNSYVIEVGSTSVLSVKGKTVTAKSAGRTTVTAKTDFDSDTLSVTVKEREKSELIISAVGNTVQTVGQASEVVFTVDARGDLRGRTVDWYVNDVRKTSLGSGTAFYFTPTDAGKFTVKAVIDGYYAQSVVRAYYDVNATGSISGSLVQMTEPISALTFSAAVKSDSRNPSDYIVWVIDGKTVYEGENTSYRYMPSAGTHTVELYVNGVKRLIDGQPSVAVTAVGAAKAPSTPSVTFDNVYPHVYINYETESDYAEVEIALPNGEKRVFSQKDPSASSRFDGGKFDAQGIIDVCASGSTRGSYGIRVKSLGDGDMILDSEYSEACTFTQISYAAKTYLETTVLDFDLYLTSEEEYIDVMEYYILSRNKTARTPRVNFSCYVAFGLDTQSEAENLFENAFEWAATSGSYDNIQVDLNSNVLTTKFSVSTINRPTRQSFTGSNYYSYAEELHAITPHINYDETKYRSADHVFPIDLKERSVSVSYTDELYFAVENNTRPVPTSGSAAQTVYEKAREALRMIVTDDMSDVEKAHAIYDWIMWKVTYDTPATIVSHNGEAYSAYYLEGVFGDGITSIKDVSTGKSVKYAPYAVCDGLSKAYTLMCNIEGIPCVRVAGVAGDSLSNSGGHAWNKVFVNNAWYLVDITWGDAQGYIDGADYELSLHNWLFLTDAQADPTHFEPYEAGESYLINAPETAAEPFDIYKEMTYNGVKIDCSITDGDDQAQRLQEIAKLFAESYEPRGSLYVPGCGTSETPYTGIDIKFEKGMALSESNAASIVRSAIRKVLPTVTVDTYLTTEKDVLVVLLSR